MSSGGSATTQRCSTATWTVRPPAMRESQPARAATAGTKPAGAPGDASDPAGAPGDASDPGALSGGALFGGALSAVALGGGHGLATTLAALRLYAAKVTAVVSVADDGGSSGRLRRAIGIPAPGDLRRCLTALADPDNPWASALEYRFPSGTDGLEDHALGNLMLAALAGPDGDLSGPAERIAHLVGACGLAFPATSVPVELEADIAGARVVGQLAVASTPGGIRRVGIIPSDAPAPPEVPDAIMSADQVVLGPGSLYTSVLAAATVRAVREALVARTGGRIYICNLAPQPPESAGYGEADHLRAVLEHGVPVDVMLIHGTSDGLNHRDTQAEIDLNGTRVVSADIADAHGAGHDPAKLARALSRLA